MTVYIPPVDPTRLALVPPHKCGLDATNSRHRLSMGVKLALLLSWLWSPSLVRAQSAPDSSLPTERHFAVEVYLAGEDASTAWILKEIRQRKGVLPRIYVINDEAAAARHQQITNYFRLKASDLPLVYGCGKTIVRPEDPATLRRQLDEMLTMTVYVRSGCPRCAAAKNFLARVAPKFPALRIVYRDLLTDRSAGTELNRLARQYERRAISVPVFHFSNQLIVGFDRESTTGKRVEDLLEKWSFSHPPADHTSLRGNRQFGTRQARLRQATDRPLHFVKAQSATEIMPVPYWLDQDHALLWRSASSKRGPPPVMLLDAPPLPLPPLPLPEEPGQRLSDDGEPLEIEESGPDDVKRDVIDLPLFGRLQAHTLGMPLFTIVVGLVDGFNPCAMWVLLFLLSILVNLHDRRKILAVAGTFVVISGLAYFAFMAAWLNVFKLVGMLRPAQILLGVGAVLIGSVHVKDFFAFKRGVSLSIPESAKPGIYARVRKIITAEHLVGAILGAATLAVLVNVIELLCTAGLPALYTEILSMQNLAIWQEYLYLALYNVAYMFDDGLMVGIVVVTLGKHKLQEHEGRWLKLVSGVVILSLGVVMLFRPGWLY